MARNCLSNIPIAFPISERTNETHSAWIMAELREKLGPFYSEIGRPSIDPELMIRMLIIGYCYGIRSERRLCEEVELHLAYRWFCRLDLDDKVPDHSTFSVNRHGRFRESDAFRHVFEAVVRTCMDTGLVKGEGFAVDASVMEADASRYHGVAPEEADWSAPERQTRAVAEFLGALDDDDPTADRKPPKVISLSDPCSAWTAKTNKRVQFGYGLNYLIDIENAVIVDVEATPARTYDEVAAARTMLELAQIIRDFINVIDPQETCAGQDFRDAKMNQCGQRLRDRSPRGRSQPERVRRIGAPMNVSEKDTRDVARIWTDRRIPAACRGAVFHDQIVESSWSRSPRLSRVKSIFPCRPCMAIAWADISAVMSPRQYLGMAVRSEETSTIQPDVVRHQRGAQSRPFSEPRDRTASGAGTSGRPSGTLPVQPARNML